MSLGAHPSFDVSLQGGTEYVVHASRFGEGLAETGGAIFRTRFVSRARGEPSVDRQMNGSSRAVDEGIRHHFPAKQQWANTEVRPYESRTLATST